MVPILAVPLADEQGWGLQVALALAAAGCAYGMGSFLFVAALKWILVGRYHPRAAPMWTPFVWLSEAVTNLYVVLICVRTSGRRAEVRKEVRAVLCRILAEWSHYSPGGERFPVRSSVLPPHEPCQPPTTHIERPTSGNSETLGHWMFDVGCWRLDVPPLRFRGSMCETCISADSLPEEEGRGEGERNGQLITEGLDLSLSYEEGEAWVALSRGGPIGVDVMSLEAVPEAEAMAQTHFGPADRSALRQSTDPVRDFALAWTQLEARCKCLKQGLTEWSEALALDTKACTTESLIIQDKLALSVATVP